MHIMHQFDVLCIGSATIDIFLSIFQDNSYVSLNEESNELQIAYGQKIPVDQCSILHGGNACNVAVGLSKLGFKTALMAELGQDELSEKIIKELGKMNVNTSFLTKEPNTSSSFSVILDFKKERTIFGQHISRKHNFSFSGLSAKTIYLTSLEPEWKKIYQEAIDLMRRTNATLVFNPGTSQLHDGLEGMKEAIQESTILFINKEEAGMILGIKEKLPNVDKLLGEVKNLGPKNVVITDGKNGSYVIDEENRIFFQEALPTNILEKTGAGDAYASGFLAAFLLKLPIETAMKWGNLNADGTMKKVGAQNGLLSRKEMEEKANA